MIPAEYSIAGKWQIRLDPEDVGVAHNWPAQEFGQSIQLPGALQNQGFGDEITAETKWTGELAKEKWLTSAQFEKYRAPGNVKFPFFLTPERHYVGPAWFKREIEIPKSFAGKRIVVKLERAHWFTQLWIDGIPLGQRDSLSIPHEYELPATIAPGKHTISIRVDNRIHINVGLWAHSITDHTQTNWNGVVGELSIYATSKIWIDNIQAWPDVQKRSVKLAVTIGNSTGQSGEGTIDIRGRKFPVQWSKAGGACEIEFPLGADAPLWDEFTPTMHVLSLHLLGNDADHFAGVSVGLRHIESRDKKLWINGREIFLRGTLECCIFPLTGYPPTDVQSWRTIMQVIRDHGLNHIRFHSWCPPKAAFVAADEAGVYLQVEVCAWAVVGDAGPVDQWLFDEAARIIREYGSHPSFIIMAHGNEPHGKVETRNAWLEKWIAHWQKNDPRRLQVGGSGWPTLDGQDLHIEMNGLRGPEGWLGRDYSARASKVDKPLLVHEMGQWAVFPDLDERAKYTGPLKQKAFDIYEDSLREMGMLDQWQDFFTASGAFQLICYKEECEAALRTPGISGIQLLDLRDFPGQGMAPVGMNDPFWNPKRYHDVSRFRRHCDQTVLLLRLQKRTLRQSETLDAKLDIAHFGPAKISNAWIDFRLLDDAGKVVLSRSVGPLDIPHGRSLAIADLQIELHSLPAPAGYVIEASIRGTTFANDWRIWVYPSTQQKAPTDVSIVPPEQAEQAIAKGGKILLIAQPGHTHPRLTFEPIFWTNILFPSSPRKTLGVLVDPKHPALAQFPTQPHSDFQWADIVRDHRAMVLTSLPRETQPIVQLIDDWNLNRKLALVFECRVGDASVVVCSADLVKRAENSLAASQLLSSILSYMSSSRFAPQTRVQWEAIKEIITPTQSLLGSLGATIDSCSSFENTHPPENIFDPDPEIFWHSQFSPNIDPLPHQVTLDLQEPRQVTGLRYVPRPDRSNGRIAKYEIYCFNDHQSIGQPTAQGDWPDSAEAKVVAFSAPVEARYVRLVALQEVQGQPFASASAIEPLVQ